MIEFRDVTVVYGASSREPHVAVEGVNLNIGAGDWVFLVGPSGAGKSTLLKLIYRAARATRGQVIVAGRDVTQLPRHDVARLRRKVGVVFQDFQLLPQKTVWENVAFALQVIGTPQQRIVREVPMALETVGLTYKSKSLPHELSGGEQQRVAIARAIVNEPRILLADEPTGNLDPQTAWDIAQLLERINQRGTTVLIATHDHTVVDAMRRRVVRIHAGRIVSDDPAGVYHFEDDAPAAAALLAESLAPEAPVAASEPDIVHPGVAPLGSPENPIVQFERAAAD